jgi:hypothetical protein
MSNKVPVPINKHGDAKNICKRFKVGGNVLELKKFGTDCPEKIIITFVKTLMSTLIYFIR